MKKAAMIVFSGFPHDPRVRREADAILEAGISLDIICLRIKEEPKHFHASRLTVHRIDISRKRGSLPRYMVEYLLFFTAALFKVSMLNIHKRFDIIHIHTIPDFLVFSALLPKLMGARVILDMHEIIPELFVKKYKLSKKHPLFQMLHWSEKLSIRSSDHVIVATPFIEKTIKERSALNGNVTTILNLPDPKIFQADSKSIARKKTEKMKIIYPGSLNKIHGVDIAIKAVSIVRKEKKLPIELHIYGSGSKKEIDELATLIRELGLEKSVFLNGTVSIEKITKVIKLMDVGIVPKRDGIFIGEAISGKLFEFALMGIPAIVARTSGDSYYFDDSMVMFFEPENVDDLAEKISVLYSSPDFGRGYALNARKLFDRVNWDNTKKELLSVYNLNSMNSLRY